MTTKPMIEPICTCARPRWSSEPIVCELHKDRPMIVLQGWSPSTPAECEQRALDAWHGVRR